MSTRIATRDYARPQRPKSPPPRGRPPPRKAAQKKNASAALGLPLWAWMVVSLSLLVFGGALYYVSRPVAPMDMAPSSEAKNGKASKAIEIPPKEPSRFAFYEMLPSYEVVVPDDVINPPKPKPGSTRNNLPAQAAPAPAGVPADLAADLPPDLRPETVAARPAEKPMTAADVKTVPPPKPAPVEPRPETVSDIARVAAATRSAEAELAAAVAREAPPQPTAQLASGERFVIQVAAFRTKPDADQRVAALTLAGLSARVEQVTIDNKDTWYRVRLGPYNSANAASAAQQSLKAQGFSGVVMKVKS
ncbi:MAG: SPOR domain-containing protein [Stagnimonas sp.]|nr:SPOR domain-containing protein [Stagnimonas sp.]